MDTSEALNRDHQRSLAGRSIPPGFVIHTRAGGTEAESAFEKPMLLPDPFEQSPALHAWADARFAVDIMAEHALFFALLMPPDLPPTSAPKPRLSTRASLRFTTASKPMDRPIRAR